MADPVPRSPASAAGAKAAIDITTKHENNNINRVFKRMSPQDYDEFECDVKLIGWKQYLLDYLMGTTIWVLNENQVAPELRYL